MLVLTDDFISCHIVRISNGRKTRLTQVTEQDRYKALRTFGFQEAVALAATKGLITLPTKTP